MPPAWIPDPKRRQTLYPAAETFCTIRHPYERLISAYYYQHLVPTKVGPIRKYTKGPCFDDSAEHASKLILESLQDVQADKPCTQSCHYLPQSHFLLHHPTTGVWTGGDDNPYKQCNRVLVLEMNLTRQFNNLMQEIDCPIRSSYIQARNAHKKTCEANPEMYDGGVNNTMYAKEYAHIKFRDLTQEVKTLAAKLYKDDLAMYGYYVAKVKKEQEELSR